MNSLRYLKEKLSHIIIFFAVLSFGHIARLNAQSVKTFEGRNEGKEAWILSNDKIECQIIIDSNKIISDKLIAQSQWAKQYGAERLSLETDADFLAEIMWTDWQAPMKINNAENPVLLNKSNFQVERHEFKDADGGKKELIILLKSSDIPLFVRLTYQLDPNSFYVRRKVALSDTGEAGHFLQKISPREGNVFGNPAIIKEGGFGQPVAFKLREGGGFFGLEYPAADNLVRPGNNNVHISCSQEMGVKIGASWVESQWVVEGLTPNTSVKLWFMKYVNDIRVAPLAPYTLYNSWYDLRSPQYPKVPEGNVMNEKNIFRIIDLIKKNMIEKHYIKLDAFVLDDGWDVYESDWMLRQKEFPRGLKPISDELKKTNTNLGMWLGPTGGYSFRMKRVNWMKSHDYEVVGKTQNTAMMCLAGKNYSSLFRKRVTDFVANEGVGFFKWDGIQFSCSEPDHGHPIGMYSRRAVMESLIDKCTAVREKNPKTFLNITSGTWLSPWWVKYANQIWMQGADYGYADVPSISPRDAAITYRDFVLYDDFKNQNMWFPIANLMTHGIIKGNLQMLGGKEEPLDKFTNEALLYFARGVSMWELYISPDILTEGEWNAMGEAMHWARDRFPILSTTEMVGGDPTKRETYGYAHFNGKRGVIAARNPWIDAGSLKVELSSSQGLDLDATSLVIEKVYPDRWISPRLYKTGLTLDIPLDGYEMAIYEIYPLSEAQEPLLAGVSFNAVQSGGETYRLSVYGKSNDATLLNPGILASKTNLHDLLNTKIIQPEPVSGTSLKFTSDASEITTSFTLDESVREGIFSLLLTPAKNVVVKKLPQVRVTIDGKEDTAKFEKGEVAGASTWYTMTIPAGKHVANIHIVPREEHTTWTGHVSAWMICHQQQQGTEIVLTTVKSGTERPMPPRPFPAGVSVKNIKLGEATISGLEMK